MEACQALNKYGWYVFQHCEDPEELARAVRVMRSALPWAPDCLGGGVERVLGNASETVDRGGVHDRPTGAWPQHLGDLVLHAQPDAFKIEGEVAIELLFGELRARFEHAGVEHGRIVERTVETAEAIDRPLDQRLHLSRPRYIGGMALSRSCTASISPAAAVFHCSAMVSVPLPVRSSHRSGALGAGGP
jgi:hypothetical protein